VGFKERGRQKMTYVGPERRRSQRISTRFIVSYRVLEEADNIDLTQTKSISLGGMLLTTNRNFLPGTRLALEIRLPFDPHPIMLVGRVVQSDEITRDLIYDTRLEFISIDDKHRKIINQTVGYYLKRGNP
jgi:c-di-GMP-binding flagellar brake protein YcgR